LLTVKAVRALEAADVVVYDRLISDEILKLVPAGTARICVGKQPGHHPIPQAEICRMLVALAGKNHRVVRLKGGDPFIFGRGCEEAAELDRAGIPYEIIPGITSAQGCAASARIPLTHRGLSTGVRYVTGHCRADEPLDLDWASLADPDTTLVVYMGRANIDEIASRLIEHGLPPETPTLAISAGTTPREQRLLCALDELPAKLREAQLPGPVLFIVGRVAGLVRRQDGEDHEAHGRTAVVA
jgi:uroporphyrin-III C-methyltransferase